MTLSGRHCARRAHRCGVVVTTPYQTWIACAHPAGHPTAHNVAASIGRDSNSFAAVTSQRPRPPPVDGWAHHCRRRTAFTMQSRLVVWHSSDRQHTTHSRRTTRGIAIIHGESGQYTQHNLCCLDQPNAACRMHAQADHTKSWVPTQLRSQVTQRPLGSIARIHSPPIPTILAITPASPCPPAPVPVCPTPHTDTASPLLTLTDTQHSVTSPTCRCQPTSQLYSTCTVRHHPHT